jgi:Carboxypeptidase regulatory-like domain
MKPGSQTSLLVLAACVLTSFVTAPTAAQRGSSPSSPSPSPAAGYVLRGIVTDTAGQPIGGAEILIADAAASVRSVRSDFDGRFEFRGLPRGPVVLRARRFGYRAQAAPIRLWPDTVPWLIVILQAVPTDIDPVVVRDRGADDSKGRLTEFYQHKRQSRVGYFFERGDIERRSPTHISEMLRTMRGAQLSSSSSIGNKVLLRGCRPVVWLNGLRVADAEMDEVALPEEVEALEVYVSMTGMPARLVDLVGKCGAVMIWTR